MNESYWATDLAFSDPHIRLVKEADSQAIANLFELNYGQQYLASDVYDGTWVKRSIYGDSVIGLVIEEGGNVLASGALLLGLGDSNDRSAEFARLVVHPSAAGHGLGSRLVRALVEAADESLDYGESHARTAHILSQHMLEENHFHAIGFLPQYVRGEHLVPYARIFRAAGQLRTTQLPRLIPEALPLAQFVLDRLGISTSNQFQEAGVGSLPTNRTYHLKALDSKAIDQLLLIRQQQPDQPLIGAFSVDQGLPVLRNRKAAYLVAVGASGTAVGAMGFQAHKESGLAKAVELIGEDPHVLGFLCRKFVETATLDCGASILEVTVSVQSPQVQRTFWNLGFKPAAYAPAVAFEDSWRIDGLKMVRLEQGWKPVNPETAKMTASAQTVVEIVRKNWLTR